MSERPSSIAQSVLQKLTFASLFFCMLKKKTGKRESVCVCKIPSTLKGCSKDIMHLCQVLWLPKPHESAS